jgi:uncharacterized membrane protein
MVITINSEFSVIAAMTLIATVFLILRQSHKNTFSEEVKSNWIVLLVSALLSILSFIGFSNDIVKEELWLLIVFTYCSYGINSFFTMLVNKIFTFLLKSTRRRH